MSERIPVGILAATGTVGQRFVQLLADHPWFEITALVGSDRSAGMPYAEATQWRIPGEMPPQFAEMVVSPLDTKLPARILFSALPNKVALELEPQLAQAGYAVCSNARAFRQTEHMPLLIPEINPGHLAMIPRQRQDRGWPGLIVTSPNCTTTGVAMPLKPLDDAFGIEKVFVVSMQAISGAGYPGVASLDITDNVYPYISGEEEKLQPETRLLLASMDGDQRVPHDLIASAHCNRVPVIDGHTSCISVGFKQRVSVEEATQVLHDFTSESTVSELPSALTKPIIVRSEPDRPQPRLDRDANNGMAVSVGRIRPCNLLDLSMVSVVHNTLRGAASGAILNAELLVQQDYVE